MANKRKMTTLGLAFIATLMVSVVLVNAKAVNLQNVQAENKPSIQCNPSSALSIGTASKARALVTHASIRTNDRGFPIRRCVSLSNVVQVDDELEAEEFDEEIFDKYVEEYEQLEPHEIPDPVPPRRCVWIVIARGHSWEIEPTKDSVEPRIPMVLWFGAKPVMDTGDGILFKVLRGIVGHDDERYKIEGYGWLRKDDGIFYMKLEGEDIWLKVVGKVYPRPDVTADCVRRLRFHPIAMKGKIGVEGEEYYFALRGRAFRICLSSSNTLVKPEEVGMKRTES